MGQRNSSEFKQGIRDAMPVILGYIPVAITFGLLVKIEGLSFIDALLFSSIVFAGAAQFMAVNSIHLGYSYPQIILATLLLNFRHVLMSTSISSRLDQKARPYSPLIAFHVTDESYALTSHKKIIKHVYMLSLQIANYFSWILGTVIGYLAGQWIPEFIVSCMGITLYAMFASLLVPEIKKGHKALVLALLAGGLNYLFIQISFLKTGWHFITAVIVAAMIGTVLFPQEEVEHFE
jgi:4-azaleucine resistance transporter AzlC